MTESKNHWSEPLCGVRVIKFHQSQSHIEAGMGQDSAGSKDIIIGLSIDIILGIK